jgi:hypothetical protein
MINNFGKKFGSKEDVVFVMGDFDKGLFVISGKINEGVTIEQAEAGIDAEIAKLQNELVAGDELQKCKNKVESTVTYSEADVLNKATNLAISELLGDANLINLEIENYQKVTAEQIKKQANLILRKTN